MKNFIIFSGDSSIVPSSLSPMLYLHYYVCLLPQLIMGSVTYFRYANRTQRQNNRALFTPFYKNYSIKSNKNPLKNQLGA